MATKTNLNAKINEVKDEIPNINNLATSSSLTAVENKKRSASNLVKKTDYNTTINDIEKKLLIIIMMNILLLQNLIS